MIINTRQDLDSIQGSPEYDQFITYLKGSITRQVNVAVYPENYNLVIDEFIEPIWETVEDLTTIQNFGFTKASLGV